MPSGAPRKQEGLRRYVLDLGDGESGAMRLKPSGGDVVVGIHESGTLAIEKPLRGDLDGWEVVVDLDLTGEAIAVREVRLRPIDGPAAVPGARALRLLNLGDRFFDEVRDAVHALGLRVAPAWLDALNNGRRSGRRGTDLAWYAEWARRRVEAQQRAPARPIKWLHEEFGNSEGSINALVNKARDKGLLTGSRTNPQLTPLAMQLLGMEE